MEKYSKAFEAFEEFVQKRCEEIIANDDVFNRMNEEIIAEEQIIKSTFDPKQLKLYLSLENKMIKLLTYEKMLICKRVISGSFLDKYNDI